MSTSTSTKMTTNATPVAIMSSEEFATKFHREAHIQYAITLDNYKDTFEYVATEHLRLSGAYWTLMALDLLEAGDRLPNVDSLIKWVQDCQNEDGGFGGNIGHDSHLLYTLSAVQVLLILDRLDAINVDKVVDYVKSLQLSDGSFQGDKWGEIDTRFSYCALNCLGILKRLGVVNVDAAVEFVLRCRNFDGGFGAVPDSESHSALIFTCVASLAIANALDRIDTNALCWWLAERQLASGGLNGRPEKKPDVCYSWWVLSSLSILHKLDWIDARKLGEYIISCQQPPQILDNSSSSSQSPPTDSTTTNPETIEDPRAKADAERISRGGGLSDRPGNMVDIFHTYFGIAGMSLLGYKPLGLIDPIWALPVAVVKRLGLRADYQQL